MSNAHSFCSFVKLDFRIPILREQKLGFPAFWFSAFVDDFQTGRKTTLHHKVKDLLRFIPGNRYWDFPFSGSHSHCNISIVPGR